MINNEALVIKAFETLIDKNISIDRDDFELLNDLRENKDINETKEEINYILNNYLN